jgi:cytochrome c-type biogenesis protein CcmH/NrfG
MGGAYELEGELQKGEEHYRNAMQLAPQEPNSYRALGSLLQKQGPEHLAESIELLRKALALDPTDVESKIVLARSLEKQGKLDEAEGLLEQAVASAPVLRRAHTALAELYRRQQKLAQAEQEQSMAAKLEDEKITKEWNIWGPKSTGDP